MDSYVTAHSEVDGMLRRLHNVIIGLTFVIIPMGIYALHGGPEAVLTVFLLLRVFRRTIRQKIFRNNVLHMLQPRRVTPYDRWPWWKQLLFWGVVISTPLMAGFLIHAIIGLLSAVGSVLLLLFCWDDTPRTVHDELHAGSFSG